jgi:hypothetical protein
MVRLPCHGVLRRCLLPLLVPAPCRHVLDHGCQHMGTARQPAFATTLPHRKGQVPHALDAVAALAQDDYTQYAGSLRVRQRTW